MNKTDTNLQTKKKTTGVSFDPTIYRRLQIVALKMQEIEGGRASVSKIIEELVLNNIKNLEKRFGINNKSIYERGRS